MIHTFCDSPIGQILLVGDGQRISGLYTAEHVRPPTVLGEHRPDAYRDVRTQLSEYFAGTRTQFDLGLDLVGTVFQRRVWQELTRIEYGHRLSYAQLAARIDAPKAVRAVGMANGRNRISIIIPCHRVIGGDGTLTGYAGGLAAKKWLLEHEAAHSSAVEGVLSRR